MILTTLDLMPKDFVRCITKTDPGNSGRYFLITSKEDNHLGLEPMTKAGKRDRRFYAGWSGMYAGYEWELIRRETG